jgi:hypothetical protein
MIVHGLYPGVAVEGLLSRMSIIRRTSDFVGLSPLMRGFQEVKDFVTTLDLPNQLPLLLHPKSCHGGGGG